MIVALLVAIVALLVATILALHHLLLRRPLPRVRGRVVVDAIRHPVSIVRDRFGVPHIHAECMEDAAFAMGFVHAQDRGWQLEITRRAAAGRLSEFAGPQALEADRFLRRLGLMRASVEEERLLTGEARRMLDAYAAGVNAVLCGGQPRPLEMLLLHLDFEPWRPAHSLACARLVSFALACDWEQTMQRTRLLSALGPARAALVDVAYPDSNPTICADTVRPLAAAVPASGSVALPRQVADRLAEAYRAAARWLPTLAGGASNSWVVSGSVTATGRPMLCNDPHLAASVPSPWYEAHVRAGGDFESAGVGLCGLPFTVIGHNRRIAWGFTNSFADVQDVVVEELDADGRRYRTETGMQECVVHREAIRVRGRPEVVEEVLETRHGPVLEVIDGEGGRRYALALQWSHLRPGRTAEGLLALQRASDWRSFRSAIDLLDVAPQNVVYADVDGHIGYALSGRIPVRRGAPSRFPLRGWTGEAEIVRYLEGDEKPQLFDPADGVIVTANNRVVGDGFPHHIAFDYANGYRAARIEQLLRGREAIDAAFMAALQLDVVSLPAREVTELLRDVRCEGLAEEARQALCAWDGALRLDAAEPCVYEAFLRHLAEEVLRPLCGDAWRLAAGEMDHPVLGFAGSLVGRLTPWLLEHWRTRDRRVLVTDDSWNVIAARALVAAVEELRRTTGRPSRWRWGRLHALPLEHALGRSRWLRWLLDAGRVEVGGDTDTVHQTAFIPSRPYETRAWAPTWRQILDVGNWDACTGIHLPGQSGHPGSRHFRDLVERWRQNRQHPMAWSPDAVAAIAEARLDLLPPSTAVERERADEEREAA